MDDSQNPSPPAGEGGAIAPDEGYAAAATLPERLSTHIDAFRHSLFAQTSVSRDTELWNAVHARFETLKADLVRLIQE